MSLVLSHLCIKLIEFYQVFLSFDRGLLMVFAPGGACKYSVHCSEYTKQQIISKGVSTGIILGVRRIITCR